MYYNTLIASCTTQVAMPFPALLLARIVVWLSNMEFLQKHCMLRHDFWKLYSLIKDDDVSINHQVMVEISVQFQSQLITGLKDSG